MYAKAKVLAILSDVTTLLLLSVLTVLAAPTGQYSAMLSFGLLLLAVTMSGQVEIPRTWMSLLGYASAIVAARWLLQGWVSFEVLAPALALGCLIRQEQGPSHAGFKSESAAGEGSDEEFADVAVRCVFVLCAGASLPSYGLEIGTLTVLFHVALITALMVLAKLVVMPFYKTEVDLPQRAGLGVAMSPLCEMGVAAVVVTLQTGADDLDPAFLTIAALSIVANLLLSTGLVAFGLRRAAATFRSLDGNYQFLGAAA